MDNRAAWIVAGLGLGAGLALLMPKPQPRTSSGELEADQDTDRAAPLLSIWDSMTRTLSPIDDAAAAVNLAAFLAAIRWAEGTAGPNGYRTLFGGRLFDSYEDHPRQPSQFTDGQGRRLWTSAAGAYQFMAVSPIPGGQTKVNTWDRLAERLGLPDFSPHSQDLAAVELIREAGALGDVQAGRFADAVQRCRRIWASLPGAGYDQPERSLYALQTQYLNAGGSLA